ncbi:conserved hypothetical protein [Perkinsus marinus ATCC 50983]|uniref:gamma-glutamylcyclotransferase n=1 Tax=Perkinsus marinus (strain ATCC 50983 / TXsc) TaxID=423536 RepID=C5LA05_PERM5|nr:conserved hypothetical protein [Perkinsus marinus ATCC 50983]EER06261.1 conserved hypothetical protein [Perkinsus marinus ATCC 50983]|eukprot:XP_002774445.1 conserved hypothetical protein [Perkinsus marinus ATCC 50983]
MFSFGANMSKDSLQSRGVETASKEPLRAILVDFDLVFDMEPREIFVKEGCYANVRPSLGAKVHGVVNYLSRSGLERLDDFESPHYERRWVKVQLYEADGEVMEAMLYIQPQREQGIEGLPGRRYLKTLIAGAVKADLDQCWIARLRSLPFVDFRKFDIDSAERKALIHGRVFEKKEIVDSRIVLATPEKLDKIEEMIYSSGDDLNVTLARFVSYEPPPVDGRNLSAEHRGFIETVMESATTDTRRLEIVGRLAGEFDFYWNHKGNL